jgi:virulence factor Mce-like protein
MMTMKTMTRALAVVVAAAVVILTAGCSFGPNELPSVRAGVSSDYEATLQFSSVLNLPPGADVVMNGLRVGQVQDLRPGEKGIDVTVGLTDDIKVPANVRAIIRQNTLLGDTYIALTPDVESEAGPPYLSEGGVVPVERTTSPPQLEDTIAVLAYFVNGGSIQKIQDTMATLNKTMPQQDDLHKLASIVAVDLKDLAGNTSEIDRTLEGFNGVSLSVTDRSDQLKAVFGDEGIYYWKRVAKSLVGHISTLLPSVGSIFEGGLWLIPMLNSLADTGEAGRGTWDRAPEATTALSNFLRTTLLPFSENPSVNITSVRVGDGKQLIGDATTILRMLGAVR